MKFSFQHLRAFLEVKSIDDVRSACSEESVLKELLGSAGRLLLRVLCAYLGTGKFKVSSLLL